MTREESPRDTRHMHEERADSEDEERNLKEYHLEPNAYEDSEHYQHKTSESDSEQVCIYRVSLPSVAKKNSSLKLS